MRKVSSYVLVELLMKKIYIPTFKPKLFLIVEWCFYSQNYEKVPLSSSTLKPPPDTSQRYQPGLY